MWTVASSFLDLLLLAGNCCFMSSEKDNWSSSNLSNTTPKIEPLFNRWWLAGRRESPPLGHILLDLASATGSWGLGEKCWHPAPLKEKALQLSAWGRGSPMFLAAPVCNNFHLAVLGKGREGALLFQMPQTFFSYRMLIDFLEQIFFICYMPFRLFPEILNC